MSVAEMLAAARTGAGGSESAPTPAEPAAEEAAEEPTVAATPKPAAKSPAGKVDRSKMSVADMIAYCREHDVS
jgi:hypothetical protein